MKTAVAFIVYKRSVTTKRVFHEISKVKPQKLYLIADGPKNISEIERCNEVRNYVENSINWDCDFNPVYSGINLGLAKRVKSGLDFVFKNEEKAIVLEDDTLPNNSFFTFCETLLNYYEDKSNVCHIAGCNYFPSAFPSGIGADYLFTARPSVWGFATWRRAWQHMDLNMPTWNHHNKEALLQEWCVSSKQKNDIRKLFDQHCMNSDPWAWSYAWTHSLWKNNSLSITPKNNLVTNIGFGPDATNTILAKSNSVGYPPCTEISGRINHPLAIERDINYEIAFDQLERGTITRRLKQRLKSFLGINSL